MFRMKTIFLLVPLLYLFANAQSNPDASASAKPEYRFICSFARWDQVALGSPVTAYVDSKQPHAVVETPAGATVELTKINNHQMVVMIYVNGKLATSPTIVEGRSTQFAMSASVVGMNCFQSLE